jgi:hypothetical protein
MSDSLFETIPETITHELPSLIDNIIAVLFKDSSTRFLKAHHVPVDGAEQSLVAFEFDGPAFDLAFNAEFRAALRARGLELPDRDNVIATHFSHS